MEILQNDHELWDILEDGLNNEKKYGRWNSFHEAAPVGNVAQTRLENQLVCEIGWRIKKIERVFSVDWGSLPIYWSK